MMDQYTLENVQITEEFGRALKTLRTANKVSGKAIADAIGKSQAYISKLERGGIKSINSEAFISYCNNSTKSDKGVQQFIKTVSDENKNLPLIAEVSLTNIDDLLVFHKVPQELIKDISDYMAESNLSAIDVAKRVNENASISDLPYYNSLPENLWYCAGDSYDDIVIRMHLSSEYVEKFLSGKIEHIHRVIAEAILYAMYSFSYGSQEARETANSKLVASRILRFRGQNVILANSQNVERIFGNLSPETADALTDIITGLKVISGLRHDTTGNGIRKIRSNFTNDPGFYYAIMSTDYSDLRDKSKDLKQEFLNEMRQLIQKYSKKEDNIELYE